MTSHPRPRGICRFDSETGEYVYVTVLILLGIVATFENLVVIIVICKNKVLQKPSIILLGLLAVIDLVTGSVVIPIKVVVMLSRMSFKFRYTFLWMFSGVVFFSISTVLAISLDRFFHALLLDKYKLTKNKLVLGLVVCWKIPLVITISLALQYFWIGLNWVSLIFFLFCIFGMIFAYLGMIIALARHTRNTADASRQAYIEDQRQAVKTTLIIICACIVLNMPPVVAIALIFMETYVQGLCAITFFVLLANSAVNPVIYCLRMPVMRKHVLRLLRIRRREEHDDESEDVFLSVVADTNI